MKLSIIIPAFNEEDYLPSTLASTQAAVAHLRARVNIDIDMIVAGQQQQTDQQQRRRDRNRDPLVAPDEAGRTPPTVGCQTRDAEWYERRRSSARVKSQEATQKELV